jgi:CubicO group peptidase (beta-lactamase class C family)
LVTRPAKGDITIRQLLSHSSGIPYDSYDQDVRIICYNDSDSTINTAEVVRRIAQLPLSHDPGKGLTYGFNLEVAGRLAEVLTGERLDKVIEDRVLKPLGMKDTYFYLPENKAKRLVPLYPIGRAALFWRRSWFERNHCGLRSFVSHDSQLGQL